MNISDFVSGDKMRLVDFGNTNAQYRRRLLALGITKGVSVVIEHIAPMGCPVQMQVRGTSLALRKDEARYIIWEQVHANTISR